MDNIIQFPKGKSKLKIVGDGNKFSIEDHPNSLNLPPFVDRNYKNSFSIGEIKCSLEFLQEYPVYGQFLSIREDNQSFSVNDFYQALFSISPIDTNKYDVQIFAHPDCNIISFDITKLSHYDRFFKIISLFIKKAKKRFLNFFRYDKSKELFTEKKYGD